MHLHTGSKSGKWARSLLHQGGKVLVSPLQGSYWTGDIPDPPSLTGQSSVSELHVVVLGAFFLLRSTLRRAGAPDDSGAPPIFQLRCSTLRRLPVTAEPLRSHNIGLKPSLGLHRLGEEAGQSQRGTWAWPMTRPVLPLPSNASPFLGPSEAYTSRHRPSEALATISKGLQRFSRYGQDFSRSTMMRLGCGGDLGSG